MINTYFPHIFQWKPMRAKKIVYFLSFLLISSAVMYCAGASQTNSVSFHGVGVTVDLAYPEEAHPAESISHNLTITTNTAVEIQNITLFVYAPVDSAWQYVNKSTIILPPLPANTSLPFVIRLTLPQNANGTLYCLLYVQTDQSADYSSYSFFTTQVRALTYSELLVAHNELLENYRVLNNSYTELNQTYTALWISYNELWANYSTLSANYNSLNSSFNSLFAQNSALQSEYNALNSTYYSLQANYTSILANNNALQTSYNSLSSSNNALQLSYNSLIGIKNALQSDFNSLNSTYQGVRTSYALLGEAYDSLNRTYTALQNEVNDFTQRINSSESALNSDRAVMFIFVATVAVLIAFVIYLKHKKTEPYVVIRKETVAIEKEEKQ
jgi:predicted nuclease with TOPRIM domain